jgi:predicted nuclease of predicted toxin-antitoxin system
MRVKLDENMPAAMTEVFRQTGHDASSVAEEGLGGTADPRILQAAAAEDRVLVTFDLDFADVRRFPVGTHGGIVVFRLHDQRWAVLEGPARHLVASGILERIRGGLAIVDEARIRIRTSQPGTYGQ